MRALPISVSLLAACAIASVLTILAAPAFSADWQASVAPKPKPAAAPATAPGAPPAAKPAGSHPTQTVLPQTLYLVRSTLLALNDANRTGNYTVLRDLSAPSVRERSSAADLATVFAALRRSNLDLSAAALMAPEFEGPPMLDAARRLLLKGEYPTQPNRIVFELAFEAVNGHWLLADIAISTRAGPKTAAAAQQTAVPRP